MLKRILIAMVLITVLTACNLSPSNNISKSITINPPNSPIADVSPTATPEFSIPLTELTEDVPVIDDEAENEAPSPETGNDSPKNHSSVDNRHEMYLNAASTDLAQRLDVSLANIDVADINYVVWKDGSLGCPKAGGFYTQALVNGYYIELEANGKTYIYHGEENKDPFLCTTATPKSNDLTLNQGEALHEKPSPKTEIPPHTDQAPSATKIAIAMLASELNVSELGIQVVTVKERATTDVICQPIFPRGLSEETSNTLQDRLFGEDAEQIDLAFKGKVYHYVAFNNPTGYAPVVMACVETTR